MTEPAKTFKVTCAHEDCRKPFHVRFPLARPDATGTSEVVVTCLHCDKQVIIVIPRDYVEEEHLYRGLTSRPVPQ
jgi:RNase P subunit RPR2